MSLDIPTRPEGPSGGAILGIDLGTVRIGLAVGDPRSGRVAPLATLRRGTPEQDAVRLERICREQGVAAIVIGLPLLLGGAEGEQARHTREWAGMLARALDVPVRLRDERLTSELAESRLGRPRRGRSGGPPARRTLRARRARIDREAAAVIVQAELDALAPPAATMAR